MNSPRGDAEKRRGSAFYDDPECFDRYRQHRTWALSPNTVMEGPAFFKELGAVAGSRVLDLGCGDAEVGRALLNAGASSYLGIDGSKRMVEAASHMLAGTTGEVLHCDIEELAAADGVYDLVISRMALHYVADLEPVIKRCYQCLAPYGRMVFTVVHPVISSHDARDSGGAPRQSWVVDDYFLNGPRDQPWLGAQTVWHHRTVEDYVSALFSAGFTLSSLRECAPCRKRFNDEEEFQRRLRIPLVLLLAGARPG